MKERIFCPKCITEQDAEIWSEAGQPWPVIAHTCERCGYLIGESEWQPVGTSAFVRAFNTLAGEIHAVAVAKGFWEGDRNDGECRCDREEAQRE